MIDRPWFWFVTAFAMAGLSLWSVHLDGGFVVAAQMLLNTMIASAIFGMKLR